MSTTSYQEKHRRYYHSHKEEIARKESEKKRWLDYYERNKEEIKRKRDLRKRGQVAVGATVPTSDGNFTASNALVMWVSTA